MKVRKIYNLTDFTFYVFKLTHCKRVSENLNNDLIWMQKIGKNKFSKKQVQNY